MIEWEMKENNESYSEVLIPKIIRNESIQQSRTFNLLHNYTQRVRMYHVSMWVLLQLSGFD